MSQQLFDYDNKLRAKKKITTICGLEETGRGCWAGPLVAAAVIFDSDDLLDEINDSKKLSDTLIQKLDAIIKSLCIGWGGAEIFHITIYQNGITFK